MSWTSVSISCLAGGRVTWTGSANRRHSTFHELVARWFGDVLPAWVLAPEVSYSIYGERGVIDILAWHPGRGRF